MAQFLHAFLVSFHNNVAHFLLKPSFLTVFSISISTIASVSSSAVFAFKIRVVAASQSSIGLQIGLSAKTFFDTSKLFLYPTKVDCARKLVKLSTKNPALNLLNPAASGMNKLAVFASYKEREV